MKAKASIMCLHHGLQPKISLKLAVQPGHAYVWILAGSDLGSLFAVCHAKRFLPLLSSTKDFASCIVL